MSLLQGLMAPSQLIKGQLGDAMEYMEEVDQSLQVWPSQTVLFCQWGLSCASILSVWQ